MSPRDDPRGDAMQRMERVHALALKIALHAFSHKWAVVRDLHEQMGIMLAERDETGGVTR